MAARRVAVVGAGLAGLAAALELKDAGWTVEVFERSRLIGGRATSFEIDGHEVDNGQHVFLACCTEFIAFAERAGMGQHLHLQDRFDVVAIAKTGRRSRLRAAALPPPLHLLASFMGYRHMSWAGRVQVALALTRIKGALRSQESFGAWLARNGQSNETIRAFWEPFVVPALNASLERISASDAAFVIATAFLSGAGAARFGWSTVPLAHIMGAAAKRADRIQLSTAVLELDVPQYSGAEISIGVAGGVRREFDAVVLAVPPNQLARLLGDPQRFGLPPLDGYEPKPIIDIHLWYEGDAVDFEFATLLDSPLQWIFQKDAGYLCCSVSAADEYVMRPTAELEQIAWDELRAALPQLASARLLRSAVTRNPYSTYLPKSGVRRPSQRTLQPNVAIAGSWTQTGWPDTMESAVRSGLAAAKVLNDVPSVMPVVKVPAVG
ncbi:MAG: hydroxysqualene dehydroxylase HpnE [Vulcanimicrobiaceae bacterium]